MDKKKVIELIEQISNTLNWHITATTESDYNAKVKALEKLEEVKTELQKSDWISVEDELPPYGEQVFVISKKGYKYVSCRRFINKNNFNSNLIDKNDFILSFEQFSDEITHWRKIDKLEV